MSERLEIQTGDATLSVRIDGEPGAPWLLLSNSLAADASMWDPQVEAFGGRRRVVRYDSRGHGASSASLPPYDLERLVADAVAILDRLDIEAADVVGLSLGGTTALALGLAHPDRVRRLVCCCARGAYPPEAVASWDQRAARVAAGGPEVVADETIARWFTEEGLRERPELARDARRMILATSREGYVGCVAALSSARVSERLSALRPPALFAAGERDAAVPPTVVKAMAEATPGAAFAVVAGAAHVANLERPEAFNAAVIPFLLDSTAGG